MYEILLWENIYKHGNGAKTRGYMQQTYCQEK